MVNKDYNKEIIEKWGNTDSYQEHQEKTKNYSKEKWITLENEMNDIFNSFSEYMKQEKELNSIETLNLVKTLQNHISENYYLCTNDILLGLGQMYVSDERFKMNIDKNADGTAEYVYNAIKVYCNK
jgi:CRISPR/Cas system-associated endonuclease/helicase Cas3